MKLNVRTKSELACSACCALQMPVVLFYLDSYINLFWALQSVLQRVSTVVSAFQMPSVLVHLDFSGTIANSVSDIFMILYVSNPGRSVRHQD